MLFTETINKNKNFLFIYKKGISIVGRAVVVYYRRNGLPLNRIGITTSKKIGNAVKRNRARRVIRAAYRDTEEKFPIGFDIVIVARGVATSIKSYNISKFFKDKVIVQMEKDLMK